MALRNGVDKSQERVRPNHPSFGNLQANDPWAVPKANLNHEAETLRSKIQQVEESKRVLQNNRQFREAQEEYETQMSALEQDKVSLMKRLNMVLSELERATHEKAELAHKVLEQERQADELKQKLEKVGALKNTVNRNLQEELRYEKELNERLKDDLNRFEKEKETLLLKLRDQEKISSDIEKETRAIQANFQKKNEELRRLEKDYDQTMARLRDFTHQLESLRSREDTQVGDKKRMQEELEILTRERNDLLRRMSDLSERYEEYVTTMNRERIELVKANRQHIKLLSAKVMWQTLEDASLFRRKQMFGEIKECSKKIHQMESKMERFAKVMFNYGKDRKRHFLRQWYRKSMNVIHENYKKLNLIDYNLAKKRKIKFFSLWRQAFLRKQTNFEAKIDAVKMWRKVILNKQELYLRKSICKWRDSVEMRHYQQDFMMHLLGKQRKRLMRQSYVKWLAVAKRDQLQDRQSNMSELITNLWFKQRVFLALRQACIQQKNQSSMLKFKAWKNWCIQDKAKKYYQRKKGLVTRIEAVREERLVKKCFDAIRYANTLQKYEATQERLQKEIPVREELERQRDIMIKANRQKDKYNLFRSMLIRYSDLKYRALCIWKDQVVYYKQTMQRMKLRLIEQHKRNLSQAFFRWKEQSDRRQIVQMVKYTEDLANETQELANTLERCNKQQQQFADCTVRQQGLKLERLRNMINRNLMRRKYERWAQVAFSVASLEDAVWKSSKTIQRRKLRNAFMKYKKQVQNEKRLDYVKNKVEWFGNARDRKALDNCMDAWKSCIKRDKKAKTFLLRAIRGVDRLISNEAFSKWKREVYQARRQVFNDNIEELNRRQNEHEQQLKLLDQQIQINQSSQKHLESKLQSQAHKIMANFMSRFIHSSQARGFYTWVDVVKETKSKKRFLQSTLLYWIRNSQGKAFRRWCEITMKQKENELLLTLQQRENQRKALQQEKDYEQNAQSNEMQRLSNELSQAVSLRDQLQHNFEKALNTHTQRLAQNVYIDKRRNILYQWQEVARQQKNARNVISAIIRKQLRMEVFTRIRLVARERHLDQVADRVLTNYMRVFKQCLARKAFSMWRFKTYGMVLGDMKQKQDKLLMTQQQNSNEIERMEQHKQSKALKIIKMKKQRQLINAWIQVSKRLKQIRLKQETLVQNIQYLQVKSATQKWHSRATRTLFLRRRNQQVVQKFQMKMIGKIYQAWMDQTRATKLFGQRLQKYVRRQQVLSLCDGFTQILHFSKSFQQRIKERKMHGYQQLFKALDRVKRNRMLEGLLQLRLRTQKKEFKQQFMARMVKQAYLERIRYFFGRWKHNSDRIKLAESINSQGDVVLERNELRRNVKALTQFLKDQGYTEQQIHDFINRKTDVQRANMHRAVVALFFKNSEFQIMPKAMNQWKRWVEQRKLVKQWSQYTVNAINHPLHWVFRKWKMQDNDSRRKLKGVLKKDLVQKIIRDDITIGSAQSRLVRMDEAIENLNIQRDSLLRHYISGQKLAIALGKNNQMRSIFRAFLKWKKETKDYEQLLLNEQLDRTNQMIKDLMMHVNRLDGINQNLQVENEELRQAALDGIEIAKAVQELTKEREQLSSDLQDRATTIKKLIEDNNSLSIRLSIAQREAEQLEQLNLQASYLNAPPEKFQK